MNAHYRRSSANKPIIYFFAAAGLLMALAAAPAAAQPMGGVTLEFDTELTSLDLVTPFPVPIPLASDPGNALGDSINGYGFVDSEVRVTLSSERLISPGPPSLGAACASQGSGGPAGQACQLTGTPAPINPNDLHNEPFQVDSFFDVFFDITVTDIDPRPGRDYAGQGPAASITLQDLSDAGNRDMQTSYPATFDKDAPNFGLLPPASTFPYIGHFNIVIPLGGDVNGNGEPDKMVFTLAAHQVDGQNATFIILPDGTVIDMMNSTADLDGAIMDVIDDPPFHIDLIGPTIAESKLVNDVVPEPSTVLLIALAGLLASFGGRRWSVN